MHIAGEIALGGAYDLDLAGSYAYVLGTTGLLHVVDISNPEAPTIVTSFDTQTLWASSVAVAGSYAYVAAQDSLRVISVSDPSSPAIIGGVAIPDCCVLDLAVAASHAYVGTGLYLLDYDVSNPTAPTLIRILGTPPPGTFVAADDNYGYFGAGDSVFVIRHDVAGWSDVVGRVGLPGAATVYGIDVLGSYLYVAYVATGDAGLQVIDVSVPTAPTLVGNAEMPWASCVAVAGSYAFVGDYYSSRLWSVDVSNPAAPTIRSYVESRGSGPLEAVDVEGSYAYVAYFGVALQVVYIANPARAATVGSVDIAVDDAPAVAVAGSYAYVAAGASGLRVVDVSNPASPAVIGSVPLVVPGQGGAWDVAVAGSYAYVADWGGRLQVVDVSNPASPTTAGFVEIPLGHLTRGVAVAGSYAYTAGGAPSLAVIDVSDPTTPTIVGGLGPIISAYRVALAGSYACVLGFVPPVTLTVIDVSNPTTPTVVGSVEVAEGIAITVAGSYAYVAAGSNGLQVVDVSNPTAPTVVGGIAPPIGSSGYVAVAGTRAYILSSYSSYWGEMHVIDVSNPAAPAFVDSVAMPAWGWGDIATQGACVYTVSPFAAVARFRVLPADCAAGIPVSVSEPAPRGRLTLQVIAMSPASPVQILYRLPEAGLMRLEVLDVAGRRVRLLDHGLRGAGEFFVGWDRRDASDRPVARGVYLVHLRAGQASLARKVVLVRH